MAGRLADAPLDPAEVLRSVEGEGGATCLFAGTVRRSNRGREVASLTYEAHRPLAERVLGELEDEAEAEPGVRRCRIVHRLGTLAVGDVSVVVAAAARSPDAAAEAARRTMEELKVRLPIWKEESYTDGSSRFLEGSPLRPGGDDDGGTEGGGGGAGRGASPADGDRA